MIDEMTAMKSIYYNSTIKRKWGESNEAELSLIAEMAVNSDFNLPSSIN